ncbi:cytochrome P450 [Gloeopeniophorella convolvens]|nr:cytochrome P450 [Gloeopeniophorella convolvens]
MPSLWLSAATAACILLVWGICQVVYNLSFHPLSHFPGPRGAACTRLWLGYMELWKGISLSDLRVQLHKEYGDVVRIAPNELHFSKPTVYNEIYNAKNKWDKDYQCYGAFDVDESFFTKTDYHASKRNRAPISNMFSRQTTSKLQHLICSKLDLMGEVLRAHHDSGHSSDMYRGFKCFAADTITAFCFASSFDQLSAPGFRGAITDAIDPSLPLWTLRKYSRACVWLIRNFPPWLLSQTSPVARALLTYKKHNGNPSLMDEAPHRIIYRELLDPVVNKGYPPPTALQLRHEAEFLFVAGSHTVSSVLVTGTYHLLRNAEIKQRLVRELRAAWPVPGEPPSWEDLEQLPLLTAVIKRPFASLRIAQLLCPVLSHHGRQPELALCFFVPDIFERPLEFLPDRWLQPDSKSLEYWLMPFSKGPRSCLGVNLAYCELYLALGHLFRRFDISSDTERPGDLKFAEHFIPRFTGEHVHAYCRPLVD